MDVHRFGKVGAVEPDELPIGAAGVTRRRFCRLVSASAVAGLASPLIAAGPAAAGHACDITLTYFDGKLYINAWGSGFLKGNITYRVDIYKSGQSGVWWTTNDLVKYYATSFTYSTFFTCGSDPYAGMLSVSTTRGEYCSDDDFVWG